VRKFNVLQNLILLIDHNRKK